MTIWNAVWASAGFWLGWWHFRRCQRMVEAMLDGSAGGGARQSVMLAGSVRHISTLVAGVLLVEVAGGDPFSLAGGMLLATMAYRVYAIRRRESD